jgi:hypothetical protein
MCRLLGEHRNWLADTSADANDPSRTLTIKV